MADRFYVPGTWEEVQELDGPEAHHLARVLRAEVGDQIEIFNGEGMFASAILTEVKKRSVQIRLNGPSHFEPLSQPEIILIVASPKGDRLRWLIEKATEMGVDRVIPLKTSRSVVDPSDSKIEKLEQTVIAACKQSHRARLMKIDDVCPISSLQSRLNLESTLLFYGDSQAGTRPANSLNLEATGSPISHIAAVIGPEGGFTDQEAGLLDEIGAIPTSLSPHILRIETAAIAFASYLYQIRVLNSAK